MILIWSDSDSEDELASISPLGIGFSRVQNGMRAGKDMRTGLVPSINSLSLKGKHNWFGSS